jgi:exosortase
VRHSPYPQSGICDIRLRYHQDQDRGISIRGHALNVLPACSVLLGVGGLIAITIIAYWPTWGALWRPHGYFVCLLAMWLLYDGRYRITAAPVRPSPWALILLIPCALIALLSGRSGIHSLQLLMLPITVLVAVWAAMGPIITRLVAVPIAFLYFAAPAWNDLLSPPLRALTVHAVGVLAPLIGLPIAMQGNFIAFPNGLTFEVTPECSGVSFLVQGLAIAMLLGELEQAPCRRRLLLLASMALVTVATNWVRVLLIIGIGYATDMQSTLATGHHVAFGYVLFVAVLAVFIWLATRRPLHDPVELKPSEAFPVWRPRFAYAATLATLVVMPALVAILDPAPAEGVSQSLGNSATEGVKAAVAAESELSS